MPGIQWRGSRQLDGTLSVDGLAQRVDHAANHTLAHRHGNDLAGALDGTASLMPSSSPSRTMETLFSSRFCAMP